MIKRVNSSRRSVRHRHECMEPTTLFTGGMLIPVAERLLQMGVRAHQGSRRCTPAALTRRDSAITSTAGGRAPQVLVEDVTTANGLHLPTFMHYVWPNTTLLSAYTRLSI